MPPRRRPRQTQELENEAQTSRRRSIITWIVLFALIGFAIYRIAQNRDVPTNGEITGESPSTSLSTNEITGNTHKVQKGDTLWSIAEKYYQDGYKWPEIAKANSLANANLIEENQTLVLPELIERKPEVQTTVSSASKAISGDSYTVIKGDTLWTIAVRAYGDGYKWPEIARANNLANPNLIHSENILKLPR